MIKENGIGFIVTCPHCHTEAGIIVKENTCIPSSIVNAYAHGKIRAIKEARSKYKCLLIVAKNLIELWEENGNVPETQALVMCYEKEIARIRNQ